MAKTSLGKRIGVVIVALPLLFFGASSFDFGADAYSAVKVGDYSLDRQTYEAVLQNQLESLVDVYGSAALQSETLRQQVGQDVRVTYARRFLTLEYMNELGLKIVDDEIQNHVLNNEEFAVDGVYSHERFTDLVDNPNFYLRNLGEDLLFTKFSENLIDSEINNDEFAAALKNYQTETRFIRHKKITVDVNQEIELEENELINYYNENLESFIDPAQIKFDYIVIDPSTLTTQIEIDEEELRLSFIERQDFNRENQERQVALILVEEEDFANELLSQINQGSDFAKLAQEHSIDSGSSEVGGDLGFLVREDFEEEVANAVFNAEVKDVVGPFDLGGQWGLFKVEGLIGRTQEEFEDVKDDLLKDIVEQEANLIVEDLLVSIEDLKLTSQGLQSIGDELDIEVNESDWISSAIAVEDFPYPFNDFNIAQEINAGEFISLNEVSNVIEREDGVFVYLYPVEQEPEELNVFEDVQDEIEATIKKQQSFVNAFTKLGDELDLLKEGEEVEDLNFDEYPLLELKLDAEERPDEITARNLNSIFSYSPSIAEESLPYFIAAIDLENDVIDVFRIEDIQFSQSDAEVDERIERIQSRFNQEMLRLGLAGDLEAKYGVTFFQFETPTTPSS